MEFESRNDYNSKRYSFDNDATAMLYCLFHFRIFDDNIEIQSCEPYGLRNVPPSTDTKETEQIYEQV